MQFATHTERKIMNDLYQIQKANTAAVQRDIPNKLAKGRFVAAEYTGLHFVGYHDYATLGEAQAKADEINARGDSSHAKVQSPHPIAASQELATAP